MIGQGQDRTYRIAEIMQLIDANYVYKFGKKECNQLVTLKIGDKTKNFELKYLSNEAPTEDEFSSWKQWNISLNETLPSKLQIGHLEEQIKWADNYSYTDEDIERIVKKNRENNLVPINYTKEKIRLLDLIQQEKVNGGDNYKIHSYYQQLTELEQKEEEEISQKKKTMGMNNINKRNAQDDIQNSQKLRQLKQIIKSNTNDPYARRSTNAAVSWIKGKKKSDKSDSEGSEILGKDSVKVPKNPTSSQKTKIKVDIDINNISLSQKKPDIFPKPILKPITTTSITVSNDQIKTLSLSDYKKANNKKD
jgi:hypothetical protein